MTTPTAFFNSPSTTTTWYVAWLSKGEAGVRITLSDCGWLSTAGTAAPPAAGRRKIPLGLIEAGSIGSLKTTVTDE